MIVNREIKFRTWDTEFKEFSEWTNRDPFFSTSGGEIFFWERTRKEDGSYDGDVILEDLGDRFVLQQYTGIKDKEGQEIYEGDIISCDEYMGNGMKDYHRPITVVIFDGCSWCYSLDKTRNWKNPHQILRYARNVKVIGNIYQNPELL